MNKNSNIKSLWLLIVLIGIIGVIRVSAYYYSLIPCENTDNSWTKGPYPAQATTQFRFGHVLFDDKILWIGQDFNYGEAQENIHGTLLFADPTGAAYTVTYPGDYSDPHPITCRVFVKNGQ
jgi:hypothetical protein